MKFEELVCYLKEQKTEDELLKALENLYNNSDTPNDIFRFDERGLRELKEKSEQLYKENAFEESLPLFKYLAFLLPHEKSSWVRLGNVNLKLDLYEHALKAYGMATLLDLSDPLPYFFSAYCYFKLNNLAESKLAIDQVLSLKKDVAEHHILRQKAFEFSNFMET